MKRSLLLLTALLVAASAPAAEPAYAKKNTRVETILASLKAAGLPTLEGDWRTIGPFDNTGGAGFDAVYPPEKEIDFDKTYPGKDGETAAWKTFKDFKLGQIVNLKLFKHNEDAC